MRNSLSAIAILLVSWSLPALAQRSVFVGKVLDGETAKPIAGATISALSSGASSKTDSTGAFRIERLGNGLQRFLVSAPGYQRGSLTLAFTRSDTIARELLLDRVGVVLPADSSKAQPLAPIAVAADPFGGFRFADFERRRATGRGQYLTRADLEKGNFYTLQDGLRTLRGIRFNCGGSTCSAQMARAPLGCPPEYIVDERVDNTFGPSMPIRDIQGIEVYTGATDVPGEFAGKNAGCGVIVIWTANGREARRK